MDESPVFGDREELRTRIALFRHSLVAPLVSTQFGRGELTRELRRLARKKHRIPGSKRKRVGVSTLRRWLALYRADGLEALKPKLRDDHGTSRTIPEQWVVKAMELRNEVPSRSARVIVEMLARLPGYPESGFKPRTLHDILVRRGLPRRLVPLPKKRKKRWRADHVNCIWQGDATPGVWLPNQADPGGKKVSTALYLWEDDFSRLVPYASFFFDEKLPRMERTLKMALLRRGVPTAVYTDRGHVYRALQFSATLAELDIKPIKSRAYYPSGRGKIERLFGIIQADFYPEAYKAIDEGSLRTLADLNESLWAWLECVYHRRIHSEIEMTPLKAFRDGLEHVRPADPVKVGRAFLWRYQRTVSKNGFISLLGNTYSLDPEWAQQRIELRLDPFDLSRVDVYRDCRPVARALVRTLKKSSVLGLDLERLEPRPVLKPSGVSFLENLRREYRRQLAAELGEVSFRDAFTPDPSTTEEDNS